MISKKLKRRIIGCPVKTARVTVVNPGALWSVNHSPDQWLVSFPQMPLTWDRGLPEYYTFSVALTRLPTPTATRTQAVITPASAPSPQACPRQAHRVSLLCVKGELDTDRDNILTDHSSKSESSHRSPDVHRMALAAHAPACSCPREQVRIKVCLSSDISEACLPLWLKWAEWKRKDR